MTKRGPALFRYYFGQIEFQLNRIVVFREPQPAGKTNHVRIAGDSGNAEGVAEDAVGRFTPHAGKRQKLIHRAGDFAAVLLDNSRARPLDIDGLVAEKTCAADARFDLF